MSDEEGLDGPIVLGVGWDVPDHLVRTAASLAASLEEHLICAFVDPASYLTEWEPLNKRTALSLDPAINDEAEFPSEQIRERLEAILGKPGRAWSFRVLNGDISKALIRLAENSGAALLVAGTGWSCPHPRLGRLLAGSISASLIHQQHRPVIIVPVAR